MPSFHSSMSVSQPARKKSTIGSLPPECLLAIISHLPPTSYAPLTQTSRCFLAFFSAHAPTICNNYILTHYPLSASHLNSTYHDGWLVPSHPAVAVQENKLLCPPALHLFNIQLPGRILLSAPGPQYLQFLQRYDFEIRTRRDMADAELAKLVNKISQDGTVISNVRGNEVGTEAVGKEGGRVLTKKMIEDRFEYMIGTYAIKNFLRRMDDFAEALQEKKVAEGRRRFDHCLETRRKRERRGRGLGEAVRARMEGVRENMRSTLVGWRKSKKDLGVKNRGLCFGEIGSFDSLEKIGCERQPRDGVVDLLWYFGDAGVFAHRRRMDLEIGAEKDEDDRAEIDGSLRATGPKNPHVERVRKGALRVLSGMVTATACFGARKHFESLD